MTSSSLVSFAGTPEHTVGPAHVWIKPAGSAVNASGQTVYSFDWSAAWKVCRRLLPQTATRAAGSTGTASFTLLQRTREENGQKVLADVDNIVRGAYVAVTLGIPQTYGVDGSATDPTWDATKAIWYGWITDIAATVSLASPSDEVGSVTAQELGTLLDAQQLRGWLSSTGATLRSPPTANYSLADGVIIGNAIDSGSGYKVFAQSPSQCGTAAANYWSRWELLKHVILVCKPPALTLSLTVPSAGVVGFLSDTTVPEVFELEGLTIKGAMDMLLPRSRGFGWYLSPTASNIQIIVYSHDPDGSFLNDGNGNQAANTPIDVPTDPALISLGRNESAGDDYDQIVIRGDRHVICGTLGYEYNSVVQGWSSSAETAYRTCPGVILPASPKLEDKLARYQEYRTAPGLDRVFAAFRFESGSDLSRTDGTPFFPLITWNGSALGIDGATSQCPSLPTTRVERSLPWPKGLQPDGTDYRSTQQIAQPEYLSPRLFRHAVSPPANDAQQWVNLLNPSQSAGTQYVQRSAPEISADERACGLLVRFSPAHEVLARNHWTDGVDAFSFNAPNTPNTGDAQNVCIDWQWLVFTVAIRSDQRVEVTKTKPGIGGGSVRRRLVIEEDGLAFWFVWRDAVLALKQAGDGSMQPWTPSITNTDPTATALDAKGYVVRNCYPLAERFANMVAAWVFRPRVSLSARMAWPDYDRSSWLAIGSMIGAFGNQPAVNTVIESISYTLTPGNAGVSFSTTLVERPALPRLPAMAGMTSPTGAGQISVSLGGTVAQAVQRNVARVTRLESQPQPPIVPAKVVQTSDNGLYQITQTAHGFTYGQVVARNGSTWALADALNVYEPLGLVLAVDSVNVFRVALTGKFYATGLVPVGEALSTTDWTCYYLNGASAGNFASETYIKAVLPSVGYALRAVFRTLDNGYIEVIGQDADKHDHQLGYTRDVLRTLSGFSSGDVLTYDPNCFGTSKPGWKAQSVTAALGSGGALTVLGNSTNASATRADIGPAPANAVLRCNSTGTALAWGGVDTASITNAAVTAAKLGSDVTFEVLKDVNITSLVTNDVPFYDTGTSKWLNRNLGPGLYQIDATYGNRYPVDGGLGSAATTVGIGATGSRLIVGAASSSIDFLQTGVVSAGTDVSVRMKTLGGSGVGFYDRVTGLPDGSSSGAAAGTKVMEWGSSATASSRYFRFGMDVSFADSAGSIAANGLTIHGQASGQWRILSSAGNFLDFYNADPVISGPIVYALCGLNIDTGNTLYFGGTTNGKITYSSSTLKLTVGASSAGISLQPGKIGFFGATAVVQQSVSAAITKQSPVTATVGYTQADYQKTLNDVDALVTAMNTMRTALTTLGLAV